MSDSDSARLKTQYMAWKAKDRTHTQAMAAKHMQITQSAVSQYLLGKIALNLETLFKFADLFGCRPEDISPTLAETFYKSVPWRDHDRWEGQPGFESYVQTAVRIEVRGKLTTSAERTALLECRGEDLGSLDIYTHHNSVYAAAVDGDALAPIIRNGWYVVFNPDMQAQPGDYVLLGSDAGQQQIAEYLFERGGVCELMQLDGLGRVSFKRDESLSMITIAGVISPNMWRKVNNRSTTVDQEKKSY